MKGDKQDLKTVLISFLKDGHRADGCESMKSTEVLRTKCMHAISPPSWGVWEHADLVTANML
jgi:hypothetical protein